MNSNNNGELEMKQQRQLHSDESSTSIKSKSSESLDLSLNISQSSQNSLSENCSYIKEVYAHNLMQELNKIKSIINKGEYTYIGMDTEFPGTIYNLNNISSDFYYKTMKLNVESTKLIQLGITLTNEKGEFPENCSYYTWQFNFQFDIDNDKSSKESLNLLKNSGIDFENLKKNGINHDKFALGLLRTGLVLNPNVKWVSYQGSYDFAYLLKYLRNEKFPENEGNYIEILTKYFPVFYDVRMLVKDDETYFYGGLNRLIKYLNIDRKGIKHQAGSDAIATIEAFHKLIENEIITETNLKKFKNVLYGIGIGKDNENTIKYLNNSNNILNISQINNFNFNNKNAFKRSNTTVFNRNMIYLQNQNMFHQINRMNSNYIKCYYPCFFFNNALINKMKMSKE